MNIESLKMKMKNILLFKKQFKEDFKSEVEFEINNKEHFYFIKYHGMKLVHKDSLKNFYGYNCEDLFEFFRENHILLPNLLKETNHFFLFEYLEGESMKDITQEDFNYLKKFENMRFFPFCNSLYTNLVRTSNGIKLIDLKHLDFEYLGIPDHVRKNMFVYMNNKEDNISNLYIENDEYVDEIISILEKDYSNIRIIKMENR